MEWWLSKTREWLTVDDPRMRGLLGEESPEALSARLVEGTTLADPAVRRALWEGGLAAIQASDDPMIQYLLSIQEPTRAIRADWEARVEAPTARASEQLAAARFAAYGDSRLSGRDRHPAPDLWPDRGHGRARPALGALHDLRRPVGPGDRRGRRSTWRRSCWPRASGSTATRC